MPFPFNSGNIKILINSIAMSRETSATNPSVLLLPVEQVERIEIIRGPGSSVYGDFAFVGRVNIITQKDEISAFVSVADRERYAAGGQVSAGNETLRFDANIAGWTSDNGEGPINNQGEEQRHSAIASLALRNTTFSYQIFDREYMTDQSVK
ncbi:MAG: outer membrane receptor for ferrienterochelin and colicins, partial [Candidatus Latescibacterota bacterium]